MREPTLKYLFLLSVTLISGAGVFGQARPVTDSAHRTPSTDTAHSHRPPAADTAGLPPDVIKPVYGPNDTIIVPAKIIGNELVPANSFEYTWVTAPMPPAMRRRFEEWTRLRNAVYVTYPYARRAGLIMNEMNAKLALMNNEGERKAYIQSREKDLKKEFTQPLEQLSIYQGKILMKLINRQTGNNCYDIIKEYRGSFTARFWQTVAFFFSSSLKQPYDPKGDDKPIESIVEEVERMYHG